MSGLTCPRCHAPHDGLADKQGWSTCRQCAFCWHPAHAEPKASAVPGAARTKSGEYTPDEPFSAGQPRTNPLSARPGGERSGRNKVILPEPPLPAAKAAAATKPREGEIDSDLFDRLEAQAHAKRSQQETMFAGQGNAKPSSRPAMPADDRPGCPVCGHRFAKIGTALFQTCPQCSTTFNAESGELAATAEGGPGQDVHGNDFIVGRTIRGCFVDRKIGEGGMGSVYHAKQLSLDRSVAIKVMPAELARNRGFIQRFEREAKSLAKINHPNILHIYDFGEDQGLGIYFMIIEFVDGKDLGEILRERRTLPPLESLDFVRQALMGLEMAAEKGVIHRDIKPDNLMIASEGGTCKVSDFGLAKGYGSLDEVTSAGVRVGTPAFMSPEQCDGIEVDFRSDVYSLGCTAYLALTGSLPFAGDSPFSIMLKHKTDPAPSLRDHDPSIDQRVDSLVQRMLAKRPDDRCLTLRVLIEQVEDLQVSLAGTPSVVRKGGGDRARSDHSGAARILQAAPEPEPPLALVDPAPLPAAAPFHAVGAAGGPLPTPAPAAHTPPPPAPRDPSRGSSDIRRRSSTSGRSSAASGRSSAASGRASAAGAEPAKRDPRRQSDARRQDARVASDARRQSDVRSLPGGGDGGTDVIEARGDTLAAAGRVDEAVGEWLRASQVSQHRARRERLLEKIDGVQRHRHRRRMLRRSMAMLALFLLALVNVYLWPPGIHNRLAAREFDRIAAEADSIENKIAKLESFADANREPWPWYVQMFPFREHYQVQAAEQARAKATELRSHFSEEINRRLAEREDKVVAEVVALAASADTPWAKVADGAATALGKLTDDSRRRKVQEVRDRAAGEVAAMAAELKRIAAVRAAGRHDEALELAARFRPAHPRAGDTAAALPLPARLRINDGEAPTGVRVLVDGVELGGESRFSRAGDQVTVVEVTAPGFATETVSLPAHGDPGELVVPVRLRPSVQWKRDLGQQPAWLRLALRPDGTVLAIGRNQIDGFSAADGAPRCRLTRDQVPVPSTGTEPGWSFLDLSGQRALVATSDGVVAGLEPRADHGLEFGRALRKGSGWPVTAFIERELTYQAGKRVQLVIEVERNAPVLVASTALEEHELWRYDQLRGKLPAQLIALDGRLFAIDDRRIHALDEDGTPIGRVDLVSQRRGPMATVDSQHVLVVPTLEGFELWRAATQGSALNQLDAGDLARLGPAPFAADGDDLLLASGGGKLQLLRWKGGRFERAWEANLPAGRTVVGAPGLGAAAATAVDDQGTIHCFARHDGAALRRFGHGRPPALPPLATDQRLIVLDADGTLTAYLIP